MTASTKCSTQDEAVKTLGTSDQVHRSNYIYMIMAKAFGAVDETFQLRGGSTDLQEHDPHPAPLWQAACGQVVERLLQFLFSCPGQLNK